MFWGAQIINLIAGSYIFYYGIPDFSAHLEVVNYLISLLFFYHVVENNMRWQKFQQQERRAIIDEERRMMEENIRQYRKEQEAKIERTPNPSDKNTSENKIQ
jgi:hypothetical protein